MVVLQAEEKYKLGDIVYCLYRNPHTQNVANIQEAAVVENPDQKGQLCLFLYETFYPINDEMAIYPTLKDAEAAYNEYFGVVDEDGLYG